MKFCTKWQWLIYDQAERPWLRNDVVDNAIAVVAQFKRGWRKFTLVACRGV